MFDVGLAVEVFFAVDSGDDAASVGGGEEFEYGSAVEIFRTDGKVLVVEVAGGAFNQVAVCVVA